MCAALAGSGRTAEPAARRRARRTDLGDLPSRRPAALGTFRPARALGRYRAAAGPAARRRRAGALGLRHEAGTPPVLPGQGPGERSHALVQDQRHGRTGSQAGSDGVQAGAAAQQGHRRRPADGETVVEGEPGLVQRLVAGVEAEQAEGFPAAIRYGGRAGRRPRAGRLRRIPVRTAWRCPAPCLGRHISCDRGQGQSSITVVVFIGASFFLLVHAAVHQVRGSAAGGGPARS